MITHKIHLKGPAHSQRAVKLRELDLYEHEANLLSAAKQITSPEAHALEIKKVEWRNGAQLMIVGVSEPTAKLDDDTKFRKYSQAELQDQLPALFTVKDLAVLEQAYRQFHDLSGVEAEAILGKMLTASED